MREIKFRALTEKQKLLVVGNLCIIKQDVGSYKEGYYISNSSGYPFAFKVDPETVGQYTGLKDRDGMEIYEGDVIEFETLDPKNNKTLVLPVAYFEHETEFCAYEQGWARYKFYAAHTKVIGNVHEKHELPV